VGIFALMTNDQPTNDRLARTRAMIDLQIAALLRTRDQLDQSFLHAIELLATASKTVTSGLGKSAFIARKMAATMASVRLPAVYLHPVDALHGDSGILDPGDVLVAFSKSGETPEVIRLVALAQELGLRVVVVTSRPQSTLAQVADASVSAMIERELDADDLLPTASTTSALMMADLLAIGTLEASGGAEERLRRSHPDGAIGATLLRTISEVMHSGASMPRVDPGSSLNAALVELTAKALGIVCVCDASNALLGILTDGDIRRLAASGSDLAQLATDDVMTRSPISVQATQTLRSALEIMERGERQIGVLPVLDGDRCVGVVRVHDIVRLNLTRP